MILISSGAYVISEFQAELGKIPPCFLPLGNKKLLEHQVESLKGAFPDEKILVSLPESYMLSDAEKFLFQKLDVTFILIPDDFSLSESISFVLNVTDYLTENHIIRIMYGDTLIHDLTKVIDSVDVLGVAYSHDSYEWKIETKDKVPLIWCGFFSFSSKSLLLRCLALNRYEFIDAVDMYRIKNHMKLHEFSQWFDLGHVNTYFRSRALITTQRAFNQLRIEQGVVHKTGFPIVKIQAEALWFENIPKVLKIFIPQYIDQYLDENQHAHYQLEYLPNMPLNELFVHGKNGEVEWKGLFDLVQNFLKSAQKSAEVLLCEEQKERIAKDFTKLVKDKTFERLDAFAKSQGIDVNKKLKYKELVLPSLFEICQSCIDKTLDLPQHYGVLHGDLCFSNILYDSRSFQIKVIDPRGLNTAGEFTIYGDQKYDVAKLAHSVLGLYDHIIAGRYQIIEDLGTGTIELCFDIDDRIYAIQENFEKLELLNGIKVFHIMPLVVLLFISMLPLHSDRPDRQKAMLVNALRLYSQYVYTSS